MSSPLNTNPVLILTVQDFGDDGVQREDAAHDGDGGAMRHGMALRGREQGATPWYDMKHLLMISDELVTRTTGDRWPRHHPYP